MYGGQVLILKYFSMDRIPPILLKHLHPGLSLSLNDISPEWNFENQFQIRGQ